MKPLTHSTWGPEERAAAHAVIDSGRTTMGPLVAEFERRYADYCGTRYCVAVNSGSSANLLMVAAHTLRFGRGTVIVPAVGWSTSYSPFEQFGWKLIFVDIDRQTLNYDLPQLWDATQKHDADLILAINLLGNPNDYDKFPRTVPILDDNCESMGARYHGQRTGSFGIMASHSTFYSHHICTMEGGLVTIVRNCWAVSVKHGPARTKQISADSDKIKKICALRGLSALRLSVPRFIWRVTSNDHSLCL